MFSSVSQNWPTAETSFQETGLHCPPDHDRKAVARVVDLVVQTAQAFGLHRGVLHIEAKATSRGPRIVEVNARMGGGRVHQYVRQVWGVDLIEAHLREALDLPPSLAPSRKPLCTVLNRLLYAPATGRLTAFELDDQAKSADSVDLDVEVEVGEPVDGPDAIFATLLAELSVSAKDLKRARAAALEVQRVPARVEPLAPLS